MSLNPTISSSKVEGTDVYNLDGDKLGSIDDLVIDKRTGHVRYAALEFGGFLGLGTDRYPLPWNMLKYDTTKDGYVVNLDPKTSLPKTILLERKEKGRWVAAKRSNVTLR